MPSSKNDRHHHHHSYSSVSFYVSIDSRLLWRCVLVLTLYTSRVARRLLPAGLLSVSQRAMIFSRFSQFALQIKRGAVHTDCKGIFSACRVFAKITSIPPLPPIFCFVQLKSKSAVSAAFELCVAMDPKTRPRFEFKDNLKTKKAVSHGCALRVCVCVSVCILFP